MILYHGYGIQYLDTSVLTDLLEKELQQPMVK
jgi:hypothetical protein